jgi:hypothetical protein
MKPLLRKELADYDVSGTSKPEMDSEMLTLILDRILSGEDISKRHQVLYQNLLSNAELRRALLDALESVEAERAGNLSRLPEAAKRNLSFLAGQGPLPVLELLDEHKWRFTWRSTLEQIRTVFSPPNMMAYRADAGAFEEPWFTLLRDEIDAGGATYAVALECTLSNQSDEDLAVFLDFAITLGGPAGESGFPIRASLRWGEYERSILLTEQGRSRFPDIPLTTVMDKDYQNIKSGLSLTLESIS